MTIKQIYNKVTEILKDTYKNEAPLIAKFLIIDTLNLENITKFILKYNEPLPEIIIKRVNNRVKKLLKHYPLQYVTHKCYFNDLTLYIGMNVFIPRPETEELACISLKKIRNTYNDSKINIIDICTGSGCIAIYLKKNLKNSIVYAIDNNPFAIKIAMCNAKALNTNIIFYIDDILNPQKNYPDFEIIISNPPYVLNSEKKFTSKNIKYEDSKAIFVPDDNPLLFYKSICSFSINHLKKNGIIFLELNSNIAYNIKNLFELKNFSCQLLKDFKGNLRFLIAQKNF